MVQEKIIRSIIAPAAVAGILILAVLTAIPSNASTTHSSSEYEKCVKSSNNCFLLNNERATSQKSSNTEKSSNSGNTAQPGNNGNGAQRTSAAANTQQGCKPTITLNVSPATTGASSYQLNGRLTCGGSGLSGKTITLTSTHVSYFGRIASPVTGPDGTFSATTTKPLTEASAWYSALGKHVELAGGTSQGASNIGNAAVAKGAIITNAGQGGNNGNAAQGASSQAANCKPAIALSAQWYPPYQNYMIRGTLTCGGSGLSGKTITLTNSHVSYFGRIGTVVTREDGSFFKSYKPSSTTKPLTTLSAWFLGGPDEGGIASKVVTPQGGPQSSNTAGTSQESSNTGNAAHENGASNTGNTAKNSNTGNGEENSNTGNGAGQKGTAEGS